MSKEIKTLVLQPPISDEIMWGRFKKGSGYVPPLGIMYIASFMESKGFSCDVVDCLVEKYKISDLKDFLSKNKYDLIGITCMTNSALDAYASAKVAREACPDAVIVLGGVHPTALPEQTVKETLESDAIIIVGEGEQTFVDIAECLKDGKDFHSVDGLAYWSKEENKVKYSTPRTPIPDLDALPLPAYDKVPMEKYGERGIYFLDSVFTVRRDFIMKHMPEIEKFKISFACNARADQLDYELLIALKKAGCWMIQIGIESGNIKSIELIKKASYSSAFKPDPNDPNGRPYLLNK